MNYLLKSYGAGRIGTFIDLAVFVAIFNALIANVMIFGRVLWSSARDRAMPDPLNRWLNAVHPTLKTPWVASLVMAAMGAVCIFSSALTGLVTLSSIVTLVFMGLMCLAALRVRRFADLPAHYVMPAWPLIPLAVLAAFVLMATGQRIHDLLITLGIAAVALAYYLLYLRPRPTSRWVLLGAVEETAKRRRPTIRSPERGRKLPPADQHLGGAQTTSRTKGATPASRRKGSAENGEFHSVSAERGRARVPA